MSLTVSSAGLAAWHGLRVVVLTGQHATNPYGAVIGTKVASNDPSATLTTTANNSLVFAVSSDWAAAGAGTVGSGQTMVDDMLPSGFSGHVWRTTSVVATSGTPTVMNLTAPPGQTWDELAYEVIAGTGLTIDASAPAVVTGNTATITTASFTPPVGSLLVAFVAYDSATTTANDQTVTDSSGLTWTRRGLKSYNAASTNGQGVESGCEIWTAIAAAAAAANPRPPVIGASWAAHRAANY